MAARTVRSVTALAAAAVLTAALLAGCGGGTTTVVPVSGGATSPVAGGAAVAGPAAVATPTAAETEDDSPCPTGGNVKKFAKTRFALHAGLALGAFHRYIYKPLRSGGFKAGADKRKRTIAKAAIAGVFALHQLKVAKRFARANPTLCRAVEGVSSRFKTLAGKLHDGTATPADIAAGKSSIDGLQRDALRTGYKFKEQNVTIPG
ncbi:hypothetical protein FLW53_01280 [Microbispora sp. SCL1-1]|uniref:hypothetical protein n=1 Tax=unclassified Microbispora TaxID=2614687 RepID=UPI0011588173|nr:MULTISPECIES: hypothetical protein [unclassified Microbispora]NJP22859.1 hypothetical protein [Microbispora sp. CL1-1]TQS16888.1 hypothetical protein FLW53_01280 [Microbispora sp. SCL1-1]